MTTYEYAEKVAEIIGGKVTRAEKANGIILTGVYIKNEKETLSPVIYIDNYLNGGLSVEEAAEKVLAIIEANKKQEFDATILNDYEKIKPLLRARLFNKKTNAEVKRSAKAYGFDDLIIIPYIDLNEYMQNAGVKVNNQLLELWDIPKQEVIDEALKNVSDNISILGMREMMKATLADVSPEVFEAMFPEEEMDEEMYVISNDTRMFGAIGAITAKEKLKEMFPKGYVILPSSVHEVIVIPINENVTESKLSQMVKEVNVSQLADEEVLGEKAYIFKEVA